MKRVDRLVPRALPIIAAFGWWADGNLPWLRGLAGPNSYRRIDRADILNGQLIPYEMILVHLPTLGWALLGAAGLLFAITERVGPVRHKHSRRQALLGLCALAGFLLVVTSARWIGFYSARLMDTGQTVVHLHFIPYFHLGAGLTICTSSLRCLRREGFSILPSLLLKPAARTPLRLAWLASAALVAMPLLPYAISEPTQGNAFHYDELTIAVLALEDPTAAEVAGSLAFIRAATWGILVISVLTITLYTWQSLVPKSDMWQSILVHAPWFTLPAVALLLFHSVRLLTSAPRLAPSGMGVGPNLVPQVAAIGLLAVLIIHARLAIASRATMEDVL